MPFKPHSTEWFKAVERLNPQQAAMTREILKLTGSEQVCSVCGDEPAQDYEIVGNVFADGSPATIRLCEDCQEIRASSNDETYRVLPNN